MRNWARDGRLHGSRYGCKPIWFIDPAHAYAGGHPERRDPALPIEACWHVGQNDQCGEARGAEIVVARRADPPPRARAKITCRPLLPVEQLCNDGVDNDHDCLTDQEHPDCQ